MIETFLKINVDPVILEVGVDEGYLKISIEDEKGNIKSILLEKDEVEGLIEFMEKKKQEL